MKTMKTEFQPSTFTPVTSGMLQRQCACGGKSGCAGECLSCQAKRNGLLQRNSTDSVDANTVPPTVHQVLLSPGQSLDRPTQDFMMTRFGYDFTKVRVHTDRIASESARSVQAHAYTVGHNIVFGANQYAPQTSAGRSLLAHELAHVVQQGGHSGILSGNGLSHEPHKMAAESRTDNSSKIHIGQPGDTYERDADSAAEVVMRNPAQRIMGGNTTHSSIHHVHAPLLQRKLVVNPTDVIPMSGGALGPAPPLTITVQALLQDFCPDGHFQVDPSTGNVTPRTAQFCQDPAPPPWMTAAISSTPVGCGCLCDTINDGRTATIAFHAGPPGTSPGSVAGPGQGQGGVPASPTVSMDPRVKVQNLIGGRWVDVPFYLVLSHELCGHALPKLKGTHVARGAGSPGGTPPQEQHAVDVERQMAAEHNPPLPRRSSDYSGGARILP